MELPETWIKWTFPLRSSSTRLNQNMWDIKTTDSKIKSCNKPFVIHHYKQFELFLKLKKDISNLIMAPVLLCISPEPNLASIHTFIFYLPFDLKVYRNIYT